MVKMDDDRNCGIFLKRGLDQFHDVNLAGVFARAGGNLQDDRRFFLGCCPHDALDNLHVIDVERANGIAAVVGLFEHFSSSYEGHG